MKKVGIVSCDKWQGKIKEDIDLCTFLCSLGIDAKIISWQQPICEQYDFLVLRSVWGYQNDYYNFKNWLLDLRQKGIILFNNPNIVLSNILKDKQFEILKRNNIDCIETYFLDRENFNYKNLLNILRNLFHESPCVIKPTISGSGENTFLVNSTDITIPNTISQEDIIRKFQTILDRNLDCSVMIQPYISEINNGEYSCIFIDGNLTHTMLRFPNVFHDKKRPFLVDDVPQPIIQLANKVENISNFSNYLYMRVDMVLINDRAKIMEVELAEPDLLTKYIEDSQKRKEVIKTLAKRIERRTR